MFSFIAAEASIFTIFVVAYLFYLGKSLSGPTPREVLELPIFGTICLLSSSFTIHMAVDSRMRPIIQPYIPLRAMWTRSKKSGRRCTYQRSTFMAIPMGLWLRKHMR